jgi:ParB family transcriptional regulator, chromosome partitioning protein
MNAAAPSRLSSLATHLKAVSKPASVVQSIEIDSIQSNPQQPRTTFDPRRHEETTASIKANGIIEPLGVTQIGPGLYELIWGERRWRGAKAAGLTHVPAIVRDKLSDFEKLKFAMIENLDREDMTPYDEARGVARLADMTSIQEVADSLNRPKAWVSKRVRIAKAPEFVTEFAAKGSVGDAEALYELAKLAEDNPEEAQRLIANHEPGGHLRAQLKAAQRPAAENPEDGDQEEGEESRGARGGATGAAGEPDLARAGRSRDAGDREEGEGKVSHAKLDSKPIQVEAVLKRGGQILLVTEDGKLRVNFSATAKKQLLKLLDS